MLALVNGDYQPRGNGLRIVTGAAALLQRILLKLTDALVGLRVDPASEIRGLDLSLHNERGYTL